MKSIVARLGIARIVGVAAVSGIVSLACAAGCTDSGAGPTGDAGGSDAGGADAAVRPSFIVLEKTTAYDGDADDLLTAGLGRSGLQNAAPPVSTPPSAAQLRRLAIYTNYRALVDVTTDGGFGRLFGPNVDKDGQVTSGEGKIAGTETLAFIDDGTGRVKVTVAIQVPATFDPLHPCIVLATSSGSRGVYGAIATAGEWGLKHGCAVAYNDKGTGTGADDLESDTVISIDGVRTPARDAAAISNFTADLTDGARAAFNAERPNRFAFKHAHSRQNVEKEWGEFGLKSIAYAFYVLNRQWATPTDPTPLRPDTTLVIASSASNGAGAALLAAEQDTEGLIDGVAVSEPQIVPPEKVDPPFAIQRGSGRAISNYGKSLDDYATYANLYQPCAALDASLADAPGIALLVGSYRDIAVRRCASLAAKGLLVATDLAGQAAEALRALHEYGYEGDSDLLQVSHYMLAYPSIALNYPLAHGRFGVEDGVCGYSYAATDPSTGAPRALPPSSADRLFALGNGIPPTAGIDIVNDRSPAKGGGSESMLDRLSVSPSTGVRDFNLDGALCLRGLATGVDPLTKAALTGDARAQALRVQTGMAEVRSTANLHGKPAIVVTGRSDALVPINHASRAYFGANRVVEGSASALTYYEVTNGQHFDGFLGVVDGYAPRYVPVHVYFNRAMDLLYAHLKSGVAIPASQVVRTTPRGTANGSHAALPISDANVPPIAARPSSADAIVFQNGVVAIPE